MFINNIKYDIIWANFLNLKEIIKKITSKFTSDMSYWEKSKMINNEVRYSFKFRNSKKLIKSIMAD